MKKKYWLILISVISVSLLFGIPTAVGSPPTVSHVFKVVTWIRGFLKSKSSLKVHGTEYAPGERGRTFLQLTDSDGDPINNATCYLWIYYPNQTVWWEGVPMEFEESGLFYYKYILPDITGVYMVRASCKYETEGVDYFAGNVTKLDVSEEEGDYRLTHDNDDDYHYLMSGANTVPFAYYSFYDVGLANTTDINIYWIGHVNPGFLSHEMGFYLYDFNQSEWDRLPNSANPTWRTWDTFVGNGVSDDLSNYTSSNGELRVGYQVNRPGEVYTDQLRVEAVGLQSNTVNHIRGSAELHVSYPGTGKTGASAGILT